MTGLVDIGGKFTAGDNDTGGQLENCFPIDFKQS
jgi:hypothetical protein